MAKRSSSLTWARTWQRSFAAITRQSVKAATPVAKRALRAEVRKLTPPPGDGGAWIAGLAMGSVGARRYRLYRPAGIGFGERLALLVMLHGCGQDAKAFAQCTRMNRIADRERFMVLYPEQDRMANPQGCWNWFDTRSGRAYGEAELVMKMVDQVCLLYHADRGRVAAAGLSAGASMAALLATRYPARFKAVVMHSGVPPGAAHSPLSAVGAMRGYRPAKVGLSPAQALNSWPPLMVIHGVLDNVVSLNNGKAAVQAWANGSGATAKASRAVQRGKRYPARITDYKLGSSTLATLVEIDSLGHAWSGGAASHSHTDGSGPDASRMLWAFVAKQFALT
ncbi:MAG: PHB depolymerase family esterase [Pseudomonadota bacterium]